MNRNNPRLIYYGLIDKILAILRGWDDISENDPREHPVVPFGNPLWRQDVIRRDRQEHDNICGYANRPNIRGYTNRPDLDRPLVCAALPYCDAKCPCNFGMNNYHVRDDSTTKDMLDYVYWQERNVAPTGGFREMRDDEWRKRFDEGVWKYVFQSQGSWYACNDVTQYGIHLRSKALYELYRLKFEIWDYEDMVRRKIHREIIIDTHNELREDGNARVDALFSNPELFSRLYMEYCNGQLESVYVTVLSRYYDYVWQLFDQIYAMEDMYNLENRLPRFAPDDGDYWLA